MPSLKTRIAYQSIAINQAQEAVSDAAVAVAAATNDLSDIAAGTLNLSAVRVGGTKFINNGGVLEPEV